VKEPQKRLNCDQQETTRVEARDSIDTSGQSSDDVIMRVHQMVEECKNNGDALENDSGNVEDQENNNEQFEDFNNSLSLYANDNSNN